MSSFGNTLRRWNMRRMLQHNPIPHRAWRNVTRRITVLQGLDAVQMAHLRELTTWFLRNKAINGVQGLNVTFPMRITVAAQACLLILNLDIDYFDNWVEVILYPARSGLIMNSRMPTDWYITKQVFYPANHGCVVR